MVFIYHDASGVPNNPKPWTENSHRWD